MSERKRLKREKMIVLVKERKELLKLPVINLTLQLILPLAKTLR